MDKLGIYLHIPFCVQKCAYCDFTSFGGASEEEQERYVRGLIREIREYGAGGETGQVRDESGPADGRPEPAGTAEDEGPAGPGIRGYLADSVFFGGGTPSLLEPHLIESLLAELEHVFRVSGEAEITLEANPGTLSAEKLAAYRRMGINRLSMGVQSMDDGILRTLGRIHDRKTVLENWRQARSAGFDNINLDLMFGVPDQRLEDWEKTLSEILALEPEHLSFYSLQIEEGTEFYRRFCSGSLSQIPEELDRRMYHTALEELEKRGYHHYEISNAAKPGFECRHNLKYWSMEDYLGLGLAAHSYIRGVRFCNTGDRDAYERGDRLEEVHRNDRRDSISDFLFTELRRIRGISLSEFELRYGQPLTGLFGPQVRRFTGEGLLETEGDFLRFTKKGLDFTNTVMRELMTAGGAHE